MKLRYNGTAKVLIEGVAHEFKDGDEIDLPDEVAEKLMQSNKFFKPVEEEKPRTKKIKLREEI